MENTVNNIHSLHVLLVEDDPVIQRIHTIYLQRLGCDVDSVGTGGQAISEYTDKYDVVILDAHLPDTDGFSLAKYIREKERINGLPKMPLILLSAYSSEYLASECEAVAIDCFATKPVTMQELQAMLMQSTAKNIKHIKINNTKEIYNE